MDVGLNKEASALLKVAQWLGPSGLSEGRSGNVSVRTPEGFLITPSGLAYATMREEDLVPVSHAGQWQHRLKPSSEWFFHRDIYGARPDVEAIVHAHPPYAVSLAVQRREIPAFHYMVAIAGGKKIPCSAYATFGTEALSDAVVSALEGYRACLMANHGIVAVGRDLDEAATVAEEVETLAKQYVLALMTGTPVLLDDEEMERVLEKFKSYGVAAVPGGTR